ncbi:MAG: hypothetical protein PF569_01955 [Candidatus Woesearchaeota archaeon]|jgi:hypothetical protein|nr:hypothetical protein [Candidatus Woesearchaeota archaeon]
MEIDWNKEFEKLKSYKRVDDIDLYSKLDISELSELKTTYKQKLKEVNPIIKTQSEELAYLRELSSLITGELGIIDTKIQILGKKK